MVIERLTQLLDDDLSSDERKTIIRHAVSCIQRLRDENASLREKTLEEAAKAAEGLLKTRDWAPESFYGRLRREMAEDIRKLI